MVCRHPQTGTPGSHGVLTRHDLSTEALNRFQKDAIIRWLIPVRGSRVDASVEV